MGEGVREGERRGVNRLTASMELKGIKCMNLLNCQHRWLYNTYNNVEWGALTHVRITKPFAHKYFQLILRYY